MNLSLIRNYTESVLAFHLNEEPGPAIPPSDTSRHAQRCLKAFTRVPSPVLILFGFGSGRLVGELDATLPPEAVLAVCETSPATARKARNDHPDIFTEDGRTVLLADTSVWASLLLLHMADLQPDEACLMLNPEIGKGEKRDELEALRRITAAAKPEAYPEAKETPSLSAAAILHPKDEGLARFFAQFPSWLEELVVVWDAEQPPETDYPCACPVRHLANPLDDFASQRNRMLEACRGESVLYLDADETLPGGAWDEVAKLAASDFQAVWFSRRTLFPDETRCKVGYGLWPDLQLRLFRREGTRFVRPVHERVEGLDGPAAILLNLPIMHESRLRKDDSRIREKLARFDSASGGNLSHTLNEDYPTLPHERLSGGPSLLRLRHNPG